MIEVKAPKLLLVTRRRSCPIFLTFYTQDGAEYFT